MPKVNGKRFPYTIKGKASAKSAAKKMAAIKTVKKTGGKV